MLTFMNGQTKEGVNSLISHNTRNKMPMFGIALYSTHLFEHSTDIASSYERHYELEIK